MLRGNLSRAPHESVLASGDRLVRYEVTTRVGEGPADSVPVSWLAAPAAASRLAAGEEVVVVGRVRRRWFRRGSAAESRTEVAADAVVAGRHATRARKAIERALAAAAEGARTVPGRRAPSEGAPGGVAAQGRR
ncbi:hypothetical protein BH18ACT4_BH18ACT4_06650 [soil metagenome]